MPYLIPIKFEIPQQEPQMLKFPNRNNENKSSDMGRVPDRKMLSITARLNETHEHQCTPFTLQKLHLGIVYVRFILHM